MDVEIKDGDIPLHRGQYHEVLKNMKPKKQYITVPDQNTAQRVWSQAKHMKLVITQRKTNDGIRIWRVT